MHINKDTQLYLTEKSGTVARRSQKFSIDIFMLKSRYRVFKYSWGKKDLTLHRACVVKPP